MQERNDNKGGEELTMGFLGNVSYLPSENHEFSLILVENYVADTVLEPLARAIALG